MTDSELRVLIYGSDAQTRAAVVAALGRRPHPDLPPVEAVEVATAPMVLRLLDAGGIDLAILDGEASPTGGMGIARQVKDEVADSPPILLLTGRRDDAWLASWSRAEAVLTHPLDPIELARTAIRLLAPRNPTPPAR